MRRPAGRPDPAQARASVAAAKDAWTPLLAALATTATLWSLNPVVDGGQWQAPSLATVLVVLATGVLTRLATTRLAVVTAAQLAAGIITLTVYFAGSHAVFGLLPGPDAVSALRALLNRAGESIQHYSSPVPAEPSIALLIALGVLGVSVAVDLAAVGLRSPAAAGLPLLVMYCVPSAVVPGGLSWPYFILAAAGWLLLLAHDSSSSLLRWGRLLPRWGTDGNGTRSAVLTDTTALSATGRRLGVVAVAAAVVLPALAPGLSEGLLTRSTGSGGSSSGLTLINPVLTLRDSLTPRENLQVLRFHTNQPDVAPLRIVTADNFDGLTWTPSVQHVNQKQRADRGLPAPPGLTSSIPTAKYTMTVQVGKNLDQDFLPLPYPTQKVDIDGRWLYDATSLNVIGDGDTVRGKTYKAQYLAVRPTVQELRAAGTVPTDIAETYTRLPRSLPDSVRQTAMDVTRGATTEYDKAMALQQWFRQEGKFTYSTDAPDDGGGDAVAAFLVARSGYCIQFSSAMAVMARSLGIPARIGVGFLPGVAQGNGWWSVRLSDAHAWPELYFEGVGWVRFEPTPASRSGSAPTWAQPAATVPSGSGAGGGAAAGSANAAEQSAGSGAKTRQLERAEDSAGAVPAPVSPDPSTGGRTAGVRVPVTSLLIALLVLAGIGLTPAAALTGRRLRRHRARDARETVEAAWADLGERAHDLAVTWPVGSTPRQVGAVLTDVIGNSTGIGGHPAPSGTPASEAQGALSRIVRAVEGTRYGRAPHPNTVESHPVEPPVEGGTADLGAVLRSSGPGQGASTPEASIGSSGLRRGGSTPDGATPVGAAPDGVGALHQDVHTVLRALARTRSRSRRVRAALLPRSGRARLRDLSRRAGGRLSGVDLRLARRVRALVPRRRATVAS